MTSMQLTADEDHAADSSETASPGGGILSIDIGGTGLKAAILNSDGEMQSQRLKIATPKPCPPDVLVEKLVELVKPLSGYECVSVGFPGVIRNGEIITAPNLGTKQLKGFNLAQALEERLGKSVRVLNDADMQGLGAIEGNGVEVVITLGTGFGSAIFLDGELMPHLELAHLQFRKGETFDEQLGTKAYKRIGKKKWNSRVRRAIETLRALINFDKLYIGGGNAQNLTLDLKPDTKVVSNECGVKGGAWLWRDRFPKE